jgi:hypothetical protein
MAQEQNKIFKLYDQSIWIAAIGLVVLTYKSLTRNNPPALQITAFLNTAVIWIIALFKVWQIDVSDDKTITFRGLLRKIIVSADDVVSFQDWLRGIRIVLKNKSIILWPFIENRDQFKSLLSTLNPNVKLVDESDEATKSSIRIVLLMLVIFLYLAGLGVWLFYSFTHDLK